MAEDEDELQRLLADDDDGIDARPSTRRSPSSLFSAKRLKPMKGDDFQPSVSSNERGSPSLAATNLALARAVAVRRKAHRVQLDEKQRGLEKELPLPMTLPSEELVAPSLLGTSAAGAKSRLTCAEMEDAIESRLFESPFPSGLLQWRLSETEKRVKLDAFDLSNGGLNLYKFLLTNPKADPSVLGWLLRVAGQAHVPIESARTAVRVLVAVLQGVSLEDFSFLSSGEIRKRLRADHDPARIPNKRQDPTPRFMSMWRLGTEVLSDALETHCLVASPATSETFEAAKTAVLQDLPPRNARREEELECEDDGQEEEEFERAQSLLSVLHWILRARGAMSPSACLVHVLRYSTTPRALMHMSIVDSIVAYLLAEESPIDAQPTALVRAVLGPEYLADVPNGALGAWKPVCLRLGWTLSSPTTELSGAGLDTWIHSCFNLDDLPMSKETYLALRLCTHFSDLVNEKSRERQSTAVIEPSWFHYCAFVLDAVSLLLLLEVRVQKNVEATSEAVDESRQRIAACLDVLPPGGLNLTTVHAASSHVSQLCDSVRRTFIFYSSSSF